MAENFNNGDTFAVIRGILNANANELNELYQKTSGAVSLSATQIVLPKDINVCSFTGGEAYLPTTTRIGKEVIVIASSNNIKIWANVANTSKMHVSFPTAVASVTLSTNERWRFIYIGFGSGSGGSVDGFWEAEKMN